MLKHLLTLLLLVALYNSLALSQEKYSDSKVGISASFQNNQYEILIPIRTGGLFLIAPALGFVSVEGVGKEINIGIAFRFYLTTRSVSSYLGFRYGALISSPKSGSNLTDNVVGLCGGGRILF